MREVERIEDLLRRSLEGEAWHGPALLDVLEDLSAEEAAAKPLPGGHSICEISVHIISWEKFILDGLNGNDRVSSANWDWPVAENITNAVWRDTVGRVKTVHTELREAVLRLADCKLDNPVVKGSPSFYIVLHGLVQHNLYHAGQIALLKKAIRTKG